ncbi:putative cytochrome p450 family protein [Rosellinia necatrix]|uniref:Putative cytochrome p450 family protein n=1 Tax=Rosellinia necatrix TaxID=77044 RepID=A0A1W2TKW5_ROSNE|nr:putative cytochrome p450 family protein [Rosellinia necatrix]
MTALSVIVLVVFAIALRLVITLNGQKRASNAHEPAWLGEPIPFISNAWQFMTNKRRFIARIRKALEDRPIVQCRLGPTRIYIITGGSNVSTIFRSSFTSEPWILSILERSAGYTPTDMAHFYADRSGPFSLPSSKDMNPPKKRIWYESHRMHDETLIAARPINAFAMSFQRFFADELAFFPVGEWVEDVRIFKFFKMQMSAAATRAIVGPRIIDLNPGFIDVFWEYEKVPEVLAFGLPPWLNRRAAKVRDRFGAMCRKWYELSDREFDWESPDRHADWEPIFGSQISKGLAQWAKDFDFSTESISGAFALFLYGLHANAIPICTWLMFELLKDLKLLEAIRAEIKHAEASKHGTSLYFDHQILTSLPLLQSVFTEVMRLHVGVLITRKATESVTIAGYTIPKGSIVQAPTEVAHLDEAVWGKPGHPASEFWAYRHVKEIEIVNPAGHPTKKLEFSISGKTGSFFPYGGGISMCAGRLFANAEILLAVAMVISRFDIEFVQWIKDDGSPSERPAQDNVAYANAVAAPPDRDIRVKWKRMW